MKKIAFLAVFGLLLFSCNKEGSIEETTIDEPTSEINPTHGGLRNSNLVYLDIPEAFKVPTSYSGGYTVEQFTVEYAYDGNMYTIQMYMKYSNDNKIEKLGFSENFANATNFPLDCILTEQDLYDELAYIMDNPNEELKVCNWCQNIKNWFKKAVSGCECTEVAQQPNGSFIQITTNSHWLLGGGVQTNYNVDGPAIPRSCNNPLCS